MKITDNLYVKVRKLWNALFGKNGDGSEIKLIKGNPTTSESDPYLAGLEIDGEVYQVLGNPETLQEFVTEYMEENPDAFQDVIAPLIAPEWDETEDYKIGILLSYQGKMYECIKDATAGTLPTNTTYFKEVSVAEVVGDLQTGLENGTIVPNKSRATESIENVSDESGTTQDNPFISQGTGTNNNVDSVDTSPVAKQIEKQGYTVANNQFVPDGIFNSTSGWYYVRATGAVSDGVLTLTSTEDGNFTAYRDDIRLMNDHKKLVYMIAKATAGKMLYISGSSSSPTFTATGSWQMCAYIELNGVGSYPRYGVYGGTTGDTCQIKEIRVIDLTQYFNGNSNIPQDLLDNPSHFSWYYNGTGSYDAGSLKNASGRYLVCTHRQLWDEVTEIGGIVSGTLNSKNFIPVIPNRTYYFRSTSNGALRFYDRSQNLMSDYSASINANATFTTPSEARFMKFYLGGTYGTTYKHDITISLYYSAEQGGEGYDQYYPYQEPSVYDTGTEELLAFDTKDPDGTWHKNSKAKTVSSGEVIDITSTYTNIKYFKIYKPSDYVGYGTYDATLGKLICNKFIASANLQTIDDASNVGKIVTASTSELWMGFAIGTTLEQAKAYCDGMTIQYLLADASKTTTQGTSFAENIEIDDYGMMYWLDTDGNLVDIPQGVKVFYPADYVLWLDTAVSTTNGDATDIALKSEITDTALAERGYNKTSDLSASITNSAGVTTAFAYLQKVGKAVLLSIRFTNGTGSAITAGTTIYTLPSSVTMSGTTYRFVGTVEDNTNVFKLNADGTLTSATNIANGALCMLNISYYTNA